MRIRLLPSAFDAEGRGVSKAQPLTTYLVEGANGAGPLAIDAGSLGLWGEANDAASIRGLVLTHAHLDHVASLPMWVEAVLAKDGAPAVVHASRDAIAVLRAHLFNGDVFPDFEEIREADGRPLLRFERMVVNAPFELAGFTLLAVPVAHSVPTHGIVVDDGVDAVAFGADSGPTQRLWDVVREHPRVRTVVLECSFPDSMGEIAEASGHLTPTSFSAELEKLPRGVRVLVSHRKPAYRDEVAEALASLVPDRCELLDPGPWVEVAPGS